MVMPTLPPQSSEEYSREEVSKMEAERGIPVFFIALALGAGTACNSSTGPGMLEVKLTAPMNTSATPVNSLLGIVVTIDQVAANPEGGGWVQIFEGPLTVDILQLSTVTRQLGPVQIPSGAVTQVRFVLDPNGPQYVVLPDGSRADLKTPSGDTSGLKLNGPFQVQPCETHVLVLDFDGPNAIEYHQTGGPSGEWILRPVIQVSSQSDQSGFCLPPDGGPNGAIG
jgi:hypothetical protein